MLDSPISHISFAAYSLLTLLSALSKDCTDFLSTQHLSIPIEHLTNQSTVFLPTLLKPGIAPLIAKDMVTFKVCDRCHGKMLPQMMNQIFQFNGKEIEIKGIQGYRCESCGNEVYEAKEIQMIDKIIRVMNDKPAVGILNLEETADYLRVRNQTVYNMIKDGRIKAYNI